MIPNVKTFNESDIVEDRKEIYELSLENPVIRYALSLCERGDITFEQAVMSACKFLAIQNRNMFNDLVKSHQEKNFPDVTILP